MSAYISVKMYTVFMILILLIQYAKMKMTLLLARKDLGVWGKLTVSGSRSSFCLDVKCWNGLSCFCFKLSAILSIRFPLNCLQLPALGRVLDGRSFGRVNGEGGICTRGLLPGDLAVSHRLADELHNDELDGGGDTALGATLHPIIISSLVTALQHQTLFLSGNVGPVLAVSYPVTLLT